MEWDIFFTSFKCVSLKDFYKQVNIQNIAQISIKKYKHSTLFDDFMISLCIVLTNQMVSRIWSM